MRSFVMDPYDEHQLRNEVIYLHSLWHQGPPRNPNPILPISNTVPLPSTPHPILPTSRTVSFPFTLHPLSQFQPHHHFLPWPPRYNQFQSSRRPTYPALSSYSRALGPVTAAAFKNNKKKNKKKRVRNIRGDEKMTQVDPQSNSGLEWPTPVPAEDSDRRSNWGWPALKPLSSSGVQPVSAEERQRLAALHVQYKEVEACRRFLLKGIGSDDDEDDHVEDDNEDEEENDGSEEFGDFILKIFVEDSELRNYYQKNYEAGVFCCLICGAIAKKNSGKKFRDCVGLLQHSMTISVKRRIHRAFGEVICKVLGWDVDRLPTIVIKGEPLECSLPMKQLELETLQGELQENADVGKDDSEVLNNQVISMERSLEAVEEDLNGVHQTTTQSSSKEYDLKSNGGNLDEKIIDQRSDPEGVADEVCHESLVSDVEWVCKSPNNDSTTSGWRSFNTRSASQTCSLSAEEQASVAVLRLQHKALEACQEFLVGNIDSDFDEEDEDELMDDNHSEENEESKFFLTEENEESKFFLRLFAEDSELRRYYENSHKEGDFYCLVCGGIGKKVWKRFKDCNALLQHSTAILRTTRKRAHRAYAQIVCEVLGWDIDRLPAIVLKGKPLDSFLSGSVHVEPEKPSEGHSDDSSVLQGSLGKVNNDSDTVSEEDHVVHRSSGGPTDSTSDKHIP